MNDKEFAKRVVKAMAKSEFTQRSLAKAVGVSQSTISRLLKGVKPALAVGIHLATVLNADHGWLIEGVEPAPEVKFDDGVRRRLRQARLLEGMNIVEIAGIAALPEQTFFAVENGSQVPNASLLALWIKILNAEERYILEGRGRIFKSESRCILISPSDMQSRQYEIAEYREQADFLKRRIERLEWEIKESKKANEAGPYHPRIISGPRKRSTWNDRDERPW